MYTSKYGIQLNWTRVHVLLQLDDLNVDINDLDADVAFVSNLNTENSALQQDLENQWAQERARNVQQEREIATLRIAVRDFKDTLLQVNSIAHNAATATHCDETSSYKTLLCTDPHCRDSTSCHKTLLLLLSAAKRHLTKHFYCSSLQ